jgi:hypothetical protein
METVKIQNRGMTWHIGADIYIPPDFDKSKTCPFIISVHPIGSCKEQPRATSIVKRWPKKVSSSSLSTPASRVAVEYHAWSRILPIVSRNAARCKATVAAACPCCVAFGRRQQGGSAGSTDRRPRSGAR